MAEVVAVDGEATATSAVLRPSGSGGRESTLALVPTAYGLHGELPDEVLPEDEIR